MFWLIDSCPKNSVCADQYRLTVSRAQVSTHWVRVFFWSYPLASCYFSNDRRLKFIFFKCIWNKSCSWAALLKFWFRPDLGRENSTGFYMQGRQSLLTFLPVTRWSRSTCKFYVLIGQNLTGEFMRRICAAFAASGNLLTDRRWRNFVSSCDVLKCLFLLDVQSEIQLLSRLFCNSWLVCLLPFLLTNAPLVKVIGNPISDVIVLKNELTHLPLLEA